MTNLRPGGGDQVGNNCRYTVWAGGQDVANSGTAQKVWTSIPNAFGPPNGVYAHAPFRNASEKLALTSWNLSIQQGTVVSVDIILPIKVSNNSATDVSNLDVNVITVTGGTVISTVNYVLNSLSSGNLIVKNVPGPWTWTDFSGSNRSIQLVTHKAANTNVDFNLDAAGFYVYSSLPCVIPSMDDIMTTVPLTDTYDNTKLLFVTAVPTYTSINQATGVITWSNIGPIAPGDTSHVGVTFLVSDVNVATNIVNSACTISTTFSAGGFANNGCASVTGTITPTGYITGVVWSDANNNNWQSTTGFDSSDFRIPNVEVILYVCAYTTGASGGTLLPPTGATNKTCAAQGPGSDPTDWVTVTTQTTDQNGAYIFTGLLDGWYAVKINTTTTPVGFNVDAAPLGGANGTGGTCTLPTCNSWVNDYVNAHLVSPYIPISSANTITQVNFGYAGAALIYGTIWQDFNGDGAHQSTDYGEDNGANGVTVTLKNSAGTTISTTQTNANGYYSFPGLTAGTYTVTVVSTTLTTGGTWIQTAQGLNWGSPCTGCSGVQTSTVSAGQVAGSYDFGYHRTGPLVIGDTVYYDWNGDGIQESNEEGIPSVTLTLYRDFNDNSLLETSDPVLMTTTTSITGYYLFTGVPTRTSAALYFVSVGTTDPNFPVKVVQTADPDEGLTTCSICNNIGRTYITSASVYTMDFGYRPYGLGAIGDTVYRDMNGDGIQNGVVETGIQSVTVWLEVDLNNDGTYSRVMTTTTDSTGYYLFSHLPNAKYRVVVDSTSSNLPQDGFNNKYIPSTPISVTTTISGANTYLNADFGFMPLGIIGDTVWQDNNGDGNQNITEPGLAGVRVWLYNDVNGDGLKGVTDTLLYTQTTSASGIYSFTGLPAGNYVVLVDTSTMTSTFHQTGDPDLISPCSGATCDSQSGLSLTPGQIDLSRDFGYQPQGVIGDFVWYDLNGNGVQEGTEFGIGGVVVSLTKPSVVVTTTTETDGYYYFGNNPAGTYTVTIKTSTLPTGVVSNTYDEDNGTVNPNNQTVLVLTTTNHLTADFGYKYNGSFSITGYIFYDTNGNGLTYIPGTDLPYSNTTVYLWDNFGHQIGSTTTDATGAYTFTSLPGGGITFTVSYDSGAPKFTDLTKTADPDVTSPNGTPGSCPTCNNYSTFQIASTNVSGKDFGLYGTLDFGDLPNTYPTLLSSEGPRAMTSTTFFLGASISAEGDGQPSSAATIDTFDDGVLRNSAIKWTPGATVPLTITVTGNNGYVVAWFDWNHDGDFADSGEMVTFGSETNGSHILNVVIPSGYVTGTQVDLRFRLYNGTPVGGGQYNGLALSAPTGNIFDGTSSIGEVEDYAWTFAPTAITLEVMTAHSGTGTLIVFALAIVAIAGAAVLFGLARRRRVA